MIQSPLGPASNPLDPVTGLPLTPTTEDQNALAAVNQGVADADPEHEVEKKLRENEEKLVRKLMHEFKVARDFDKQTRAQYAVDRRYAAGTADITWAVNTNLIGSFIDILVAFLYARNPDVSVRKAPLVDNFGSKDQDAFAKTLELVISSLWRAPLTRAKQNLRKQVRSGLSLGAGWLKVLLISEGANIPQLESDLKDSRQNLADLEAMRAKLSDEGYDADSDPDCTAQKIEEARQLTVSLESKVEASLRKRLVVDFVRAENMQVSLDVASYADHVDAQWNGNITYIRKDELCSLFPKLTKEDIQSATEYYHRSQRTPIPVTDQVNMPDGYGDNAQLSDEANEYTTASQASGSVDMQTPPFAQVIEIWDGRTNHISTMIDGVKVWAKEPYQPDYPTSRFYPYFYLEFFPVDGARAGQSLSWRLSKLQDEYARSRSNFRITRERSIPGTLFDSRNVSPDDIRKIEKSSLQEFTGIATTDASQSIKDAFAAKPVSSIDPRLYDNTPILSDMEKIAGVQEALQSSISVEKTATEAEIQQSGFASRTTADRDTLETMLTEMAHYTSELALSGLRTKDVQRIAGPAAFWPEGMDIDDLLTLVEIEILAGTTGKPKTAGDREAWGVILPQIVGMVGQIQMAQMTGDVGMANALTELIRETMTRMGDETDPSRFIPTMPQLPGQPGAAPGMPMAQGAAPGAPLPPEAGAGPNNPELMPPEAGPIL